MSSHQHINHDIGKVYAIGYLRVADYLSIGMGRIGDGCVFGKNLMLVLYSIWREWQKGLQSNPTTFAYWSDKKHKWIVCIS